MLLKMGKRFELEIGRHMTFLRMGRYEAIYTQRRPDDRTNA
jgi:hypothetical protein